MCVDSGRHALQPVPAPGQAPVGALGAASTAHQEAARPVPAKSSPTSSTCTHSCQALQGTGEHVSLLSAAEGCAGASRTVQHSLSGRGACHLQRRGHSVYQCTGLSQHPLHVEGFLVLMLGLVCRSSTLLRTWPVSMFSKQPAAAAAAGRLPSRAAVWQAHLQMCSSSWCLSSIAQAGTWPSSSSSSPCCVSW